MDGSSNLCLDFQNRSHLLRNISFVSLPPKNNGKKSYVGVLCRTPFLYWLHNSWRDPIIVGHTRILSHDLKFVPNYRFAVPIIFEIDIMKKSSPINLNLFQTWLFHNFFLLFLLFWFTLKLSWECCESSRKEVSFWFWQWRKMWILNWVGMSFS